MGQQIKFVITGSAERRSGGNQRRDELEAAVQAELEKVIIDVSERLDWQLDATVEILPD